MDRYDERFDLIDTGGIGNIDGAQSQSDIDIGTRRQVDIALEDAAVVIFVLDVETGVTPLDEEVARILHRSDRTVFIAANKCDTLERDSRADEFARYGFNVYPVSALHNRGFGEMMDAVVAALPAAENVTLKRPLRVTVVGRPNVGKSSYINRLLRHDRVIVSEVPGTTRDSIEIPFTVGQGEQARHYVLTDTAGPRRRGKIAGGVETFSAMRAEKSVSRSDVIIMMLDATQGATAQDRKIAAKILEHRRGCVLVVNKWDAMENTTQRRYGPELSHSLPFLEHIPVVYISALSGYNVRRSIDVIDHVAAQVARTLPTGVLNRVVIDAYERMHPPLVKGKPLKIYYCVQVRHQPIGIDLFVNDPRRVRSAYQSYLVRSIREAFGIEGAPVVLRFRARRK